MSRLVIWSFPKWRWLCWFGWHQYLAAIKGWTGEGDDEKPIFDDWKCEICGKRKPYKP